MTEKNYNAKQQENKVLSKQKNVESKKIENKINEKKVENKVNEKKEIVENKIKEEKIENNKETQNKTEKKKQIQIIKKDEANANGVSLPISTKDSVAICKFIVNKPLDKAIEDLEQVAQFKKAIPMNKGFPHRKGKGMMAGRYHTKPVGFFIRMLKDLKANANVNGIDNPIIIEAVPNRASRPYGRFGRVKRKRTHVHIKVIEKSKINKKNKKGESKLEDKK